MSSVDNRVVNMQFNNSRFEANAKKTMSTLDKLKAKLSFKDETRGLRDFQSSVDSFSISHIADAIDLITEKVESLGTIGFNAMNRIANAAIDAGMKIARSIGIDQVTAGFGKYTSETNAAQTILAAVSRKGGTIDDVYEALNQLTDYSDRTSFSFSNTTSALSMFIAAGNQLDESVTTIQGIGNAASVAGVSIQDAAIAFRNFSDAMGKGKFQLSDWKSIQLIHMDTEELREEFIKTAQDLHLLDSEGYILQQNGRRARNAVQVTTTNFADTLRYGWLNTRVMVDTMARYADETTEFGQRAWDAAVQCRTFADVIDTVKDSVSTGWNLSFRTIFGNVEEATELFTNMADTIVDALSTIREFRNNVLTSWSGMGGRDSLISALHNIWELGGSIKDHVLKPILEDITHAWDHGGGGLGSLDQSSRVGGRLAILTQRASDGIARFSEWVQTSDRLHETVALVGDAFRWVEQIGKGVWGFISSVWDQLKPSFSAIWDFINEIGRDLFGLGEDVGRSVFFLDLPSYIRNVANLLEPITSRLPRVINKVKDLYRRFRDFLKTNPRVQQMKNSLKNLFNSFTNFIPGAIDSIEDFGHRLYETIKNSDEWKWLKRNWDTYVKPIIDKISEFGVLFTDTLGDFFSIDTSDEDSLWDKIKKRFSVFDNLGPWFENEWNQLKQKYPFLQEIEDWWNTSPVVREIKEFFKTIGSAIDLFFSTEVATDENGEADNSIISHISKRWDAAWSVLEPYFNQKIEQIKTWFRNKWNELKEEHPFLQTIENLFNKSDADNVEGQLEKKFTVFDKIRDFINGLDIVKVGAITAIIVAFVALLGAFKTVHDILNIGKEVSKLVKSIREVFDQLSGLIGAKKMELRAKSLLFIAASVWLLAKVVKELGEMDTAKAIQGVLGVAALFGIEGAFFYLMKKFDALPPITTNWLAIIGVALSIMVLAETLARLSSIQFEEGVKALGLMMGLFTELGLFEFLTGLMHKIKGFKPISEAQLLAATGSIYLLGEELQKLALLSWSEIDKGLTAMAGLFSELALFELMTGLMHKIKEFKPLSAKSMLAATGSIYLLGEELQKLALLNWSEIDKGLTAMAGLFSELALFELMTGLMHKIEGFKPVSGLSLAAIAGSMYVLGEELQKLASLSWEQIGKGLTTMAGLFTETGAFTFLIGLMSSKIKNFDPNKANWAYGAMAAGMAQLANSVANLGQLSVKELIKGGVALAIIMGLMSAFMFIVGKMQSLKFGIRVGLTFALIGAAMWLMAQAFVPLGTMSLNGIKKATLAMAIIMALMLAFQFAVSKITVGVNVIKQSVSMLVSGIVVAGVMIAFAFALSMIKDIDPNLITTFGAAMGAMTVAVAAMGLVIERLSGISIGAAVKGAIVMIIAAAAIGAAIALIMTLVSGAISGFSDTIAHVGANIAQYADMVDNIDFDALGESTDFIVNMAGTLVAVGMQNYGSIETFLHCMNRIGGALVIFDTELAKIQSMQKLKDAMDDVKSMADTFALIPDVDDKSTQIARVGGAIGLYVHSINDVLGDGETVDVSSLPDSNAIKAIFDALTEAFGTSEDLPTDQELAEVGAFATGERATALTNFAIGLENIATAVSNFSSVASTLDFGNIDLGISALKNLSSVAPVLDVSATVTIGSFSLTLHEERENLDLFADDIIALGSALENFSTSCTNVSFSGTDLGIRALSKITEINKALPPTGGLRGLLLGEQKLDGFAANIRLLGAGAAAFSESIAGANFNETQGIMHNATATIKALALANAALPPTGGLRGILSGNADFTNFSTRLEALGEGAAAFSNAIIEGSFGNTNVSMIESAANTILILARANAALPRSGGINEWFNGSIDLEKFVSDTAVLGQAVSAFALVINNPTIGLTDDAIQKTVAMAGVLEAIASVYSSAYTLTRGDYGVNNIESAVAVVDIIKENALDFIMDLVEIQDEQGAVDPDKLSNLRAVVDIFTAMEGMMQSLTDESISSDVDDYTGKIRELCTFFSSDDFPNVDPNVSAVLGKISELNTSLDTLLAHDFTTAFATFTSNGSSLVTALFAAFSTAEGNTTAESTINSLMNYLNTSIRGHETDFSNTGAYMMRGLKDGILLNRLQPVLATERVIVDCINRANAILGIHSPSREFANMGMFVDYGFAQGLSGYATAVDAAAGEVSQTAINRVLADMWALTNLPLDNMALQPSIRPVIDSTAIASGIGDIDGMIGSGANLRLDTRGLDIQAQMLGLDYTYDIMSIAQQVQGMNDKLTNLTEVMSQMQIVLDSGVLVGQLEGPLDRRMGDRLRRGERGN